MEGLMAAIRGRMDPMLIRRAYPRAGEAKRTEPAT